MKNKIDYVKKLWKECSLPYIVAGTLLIGGFVYVGHTFSKLFLKDNLETQIQEETFQERVLEAAKDSSNVRQEGVFRYVNINGDKEYDAVLFPAPTRYGCMEIIKLKGGKLR